MHQISGSAAAAHQGVFLSGAPGASVDVNGEHASSRMSGSGSARRSCSEAEIDAAVRHGRVAQKGGVGDRARMLGALQDPHPAFQGGIIEGGATWQMPPPMPSRISPF